MKLIKKYLFLLTNLREAERKSNAVIDKIDSVVAALNGESDWFLCMGRKAKECDLEELKRKRKEANERRAIRKKESGK